MHKLNLPEYSLVDPQVRIYDLSKGVPVLMHGGPGFVDLQIPVPLYRFPRYPNRIAVSPSGVAKDPINVGWGPNSVAVVTKVLHGKPKRRFFFKKANSIRIFQGVLALP